MSEFTVMAGELKKTHPQSAVLLKAFVPLLEAQHVLANEFADESLLPKLDMQAFALGKSWMQAGQLPFSDLLIKKGAKKIASAAGKGFPELKDSLKMLGAYLAKHPEAGRDLVLIALGKNQRALASWVKKYEMEPGSAQLLGMHLGATVARSVQAAAASRVLPPWSKGYCPVCGSRPHGSVLRQTEGYRFLECSLCGHSWRFSRTTCPVCEQNEPEKLPVFTFDKYPGERIDACDTCKHYMLGLDMRKSGVTSSSLALPLLCMVPLDVLMQEKGYAPASEASM